MGIYLSSKKDIGEIRINTSVQNFQNIVNGCIIRKGLELNGECEVSN